MRIFRLLVPFTVIGFAFLPAAHAVVPPPDGGYPGGNTAEGQNALLSLTTGVNNTAVGWFSLKSNTDGQLNTAVGAGTLLSTVRGSRNTAIGGAALFSDADGSFNTAVGALALWSNTFGNTNTAIGDSALFFNTSGGANTATGVNALSNNTGGDQNTATGYAALANNTTGDDNTANGVSALAHNTIGGLNTAVGFFTLSSNTTGGGNTAVGYQALVGSSTGSGNTAVGYDALIGHNGNENTALGDFAGAGQSTGDNNIYIGANVIGVTGESNTIRIGNNDITDTFITGISGTTVASGAAVLVDSNGHLGTMTSSKRFKEEIRPMNTTSEAIFSLEPVTFRYRKEIDPAGTSQFGLIAEQVAKVNPTLVLRDKDGKPYTVRYEAVNAMLLNEFLKEHRHVQEQDATIAQQQKQIDALTAGLQKVSTQLATANGAAGMRRDIHGLNRQADMSGSEFINRSRDRLEASKPAPEIVNNP
jgi:Chaperone of endosialidase